VSSSEAEHAIAAGLLQKPGRIVEVEALTPDHFKDAAVRRIFVLARTYREARKGKILLDLPLARSLLERAPATSKKARALLPVVEEYARLAPVSEAEFKDAVASLSVLRRKALTKERATQAVEASLEGDDELARDNFRRGLLEAGDADDDRPEDLRSRGQFEAELLELKKPIVQGESFDPGFTFLTSRTTFRRGQFTVIGGYAKDGKTHVAKTFAYNASELSGARVLFTSLEMDKREMRVLFVCHHASTLDPRGVPYLKILDRTASKTELRLYARAMVDFRVAEGAGDDPDVGMVVGDYLELFRPTVKTRDYRHDLTEMCYEAKETAREADVWSVMCHQISRAGREAAEKRAPRHYIARDYGESAGIERSVSQLVWVYSDEALKADRQARLGMALVRTGDSLVEGEEIFFDPRNAFMGQEHS
jgi:replicative DNA helicase